MDGQLHAAWLSLFPEQKWPAACSRPSPFSKEKTETDQLHADFLGCCVRKELEGRRSD
jgi:hypothetical protein